MGMSTIWDKWRSTVSNMNARGIPIPMVRDPKTGMGSVSLTLVLIAATLVIVSLVGKLSGAVGTINLDKSLEFFYAASALYFGRSWVGKGSASASESQSEPK